ncbi:MAG: ABC transporter permease [Bacteroidota bacterium]
MLKNYFIVAFRHLRRQPGYAALNILGLTIGILSCFLIVMYLQQELSFDAYHENADQVYRVSSRISEPDDAFNWATTQLPLGRTVTEKFGEVQQYARMQPRGRTTVRQGENTYYIEDSYLADSTLFELFTFDFVKGDPRSALSEPNSIVLSESEVQKIFGREDPMEQLLELDDNSLKVTGVYRDQPNNSHFIANAMISFNTVPYHNAEAWGGFNLYTYLKLFPGANPNTVLDKLNQEIMDEYVAVIFDEYEIEIIYDLMNIRDIHLLSDFEGEPQPLGNMDYIYIFAAVAVFLILIACINYMNLATARSMKRSLEVGIRKVMGAQRGTLIGQFIAESVLISLLAFVLSVLLLLVIVPLVNSQLGTSFDIRSLMTPQMGLLVVAVLLVTGILSGSYPAFYLSAFQPIKALKGGAAAKGGGNKWLRRVLVGIQFAISIFMLISTLVIYDQMQFVRSKDLGFDKEQVFTFAMTRSTRERWPVLKNLLLQNTHITEAGTASTIPGGGYPKNLLPVENNEGVMTDYGINLMSVDFDYFKTLGVEMVAGRDFSTAYPSDTATAVIVNESMVARFSWDEPLGKRFQYSRDSTVFHRVIGVAKDFHHRSLYDPIEPLLFVPEVNNSRVLVRIDQNVPAALQHAESSWQEVFPNRPFEPMFLDQNFLESYEDDQLRGTLFLSFSITMIVIAALGLLGLASFTAEQRTKEISIRKVLGATTSGLISLLVAEFVWLVLLGAVPAFVFAYWFASGWLESFEYHTNVNYFLFVLVTVIILLITMLTTGIHAFRAAVTNPSENLKYE